MILHKQITTKTQQTLIFIQNPKPKKPHKQTLANKKRTIHEKKKKNTTNKPKGKKTHLFHMPRLLLL